MVRAYFWGFILGIALWFFALGYLIRPTPDYSGHVMPLTQRLKEFTSLTIPYLYVLLVPIFGYSFFLSLTWAQSVIVGCGFIAGLIVLLHAFVFPYLEK